MANRASSIIPGLSLFIFGALIAFASGGEGAGYYIGFAGLLGGGSMLAQSLNQIVYGKKKEQDADPEVQGG